MPSKFSRPVKAGDRFYHRTAGAGGWGDPLDRDPVAVAGDVRNGILSRERAFRAYGVVLGDDGRSLDEAATDAERVARRIGRPRTSGTEGLVPTPLAERSAPTR
jgi:N-methylhydantoinase B